METRGKAYRPARGQGPTRRSARARIAAGLAAGALGLLGAAGCDDGSEIEPTTEEPGFETQLPDADETDEQLDDARDDDLLEEEPLEGEPQEGS